MAVISELAEIGETTKFVRNKIILSIDLFGCKQEKQFLQADFFQLPIEQLQQSRFYFSPVKHDTKL